MNAEREQLLKIADKYRNQGYEVAFHPNPEDLPSFLKNYRLDMIVRRGDEAVVVEVKSRSSLNSLSNQYLSSLAEVIEQHHGWRLELVISNSEDAATYPSKAEGSLQKNEIKSRLPMVKQIAVQNVDAAILYSWSLLEATLRLIAEKEGLSLQRFDSLYLVKYLTAEGVISRSDYQLLMNARSLRNVIAHGFKNSRHITPDTVGEFIGITVKLLEDLSSDTK